MLLFYIYNEEMGIFLHLLTTFNIFRQWRQAGTRDKKKYPVRLLTRGIYEEYVIPI